MNKENAKALFESGEIEKYSKEYFSNYGKRGVQKKIKKYGKKGMSAIAHKAWETKRAKKFSTD